MFCAGVLLLGVAAASAVTLLWIDRHGWLGEADSNPIGFGLLMVSSGLAGFVLTLVGMIRAIDASRRDREKQRAV